MTYDMTVMVIEDEEMLLQAIAKKLSGKGYGTVTCTTAKQALDYLKSMKEPPDIIWLDYYLEDMNGLEFMQELKTNDEWSKIPVVVISNSASEEKKSSMLALGAKKYILKAKYTLGEIIDVLEEIVEEGGV